MLDSDKSSYVEKKKQLKKKRHAEAVTCPKIKKCRGTLSGMNIDELS